MVSATGVYTTYEQPPTDLQPDCRPAHADHLAGSYYDFYSKYFHLCSFWWHLLYSVFLARGREQRSVHQHQSLHSRLVL